MNDKFNNRLIEEPQLIQKDTLMACFTQFLYGTTNQELRKSLRSKLLKSSTDPQFIQLNQKEGIISNVGEFCKLMASEYHLLIHIFDENCREEVFGDHGASVYVKKGEGGRFSLLKMEDPPLADHHLFDLWIHPEPGKAINLVPLVASNYSVHSVNIVPESNLLYSIIPHNRLWRHVLINPEDALYVFADMALVSVQVHHGKTNPYFYLSANANGGTVCIRALICPDGELNATNRMREFSALVGKRV